MRAFPESAVDPKLCLFEFVYFARPDSRLYSRSVHFARVRMGELLAEQAPVEADMVMGVPESGVPAAEGFAHACGIPYGQGLVKNRYIGRTFIAPSQELRAQAVRMKLNPLRENIAGKRLVVIDDSIVRGTTQKQLVKMLREAGAAEVHLRITSPPVRWPCFFGIDTGDRSELLAASMSVEEIRDYLNVDTLAYLGIDRLLASTGAVGAGFCDACFTGEYPVEVPVDLRKDVLESGEPVAADGSAARPVPLLSDDEADLPAAHAQRALAVARWVRPTKAPASPSTPAKRRSSASRPRSARRSGPRSSATSVGSAGCSASTRPATASRCWSPRPTGSAPRR